MTRLVAGLALLALVACQSPTAPDRAPYPGVSVTASCSSVWAYRVDTLLGGAAIVYMPPGSTLRLDLRGTHALYAYELNPSSGAALTDVRADSVTAPASVRWQCAP